MFALSGTGSGCSGFEGQARVEASFKSLECEADHERSGLEGYGYDAGWVATERFSGVFIIFIHRHQVQLVETDVLAIRMNLNQLIEQGRLSVQDGEIRLVDPASPLVLKASMDRDDVNASLSLFVTCPEFPTHPASSGQLTLTELLLQDDPEDTGRQERIRGTLTATLTRANTDGESVATLFSSFDFQPPRRPLAVFK